MGPVKTCKGGLSEACVLRTVEKFPLSTVFGSLAEFAANQHGSQFIQLKIENASLDDCNTLALESIQSLSVLILDPYANFALQSILRHCDALMQQSFVDTLLWHGMLLPLASHDFGCHVLQALFEIATASQQHFMMLNLRTEYSSEAMIESRNGSFALSYVVRLVPLSEWSFVFDYFRGQAVKLSTHQYASKVLLKVLAHGPPQEVGDLIDELLPQMEFIAKDRYGNFVASQVMEHGPDSYRTRVFESLHDKFVGLSLNKFASNVVERCIVSGTEEQRNRVVTEILGGEPLSLDGILGQKSEEVGIEGVLVTPLVAIMVHPFGNYVVQSILKTGSESQTERVKSIVNECGSTLAGGKFSKHTLAQALVQ